MFYKKNTRFARLKAIVVLPLALCIVMLYAIGCQQSANKSSTAVEKDSALALVKEAPAVQATDSTVPSPPPPPPPPPPSKTSVTQPPPPPPPPPPGTKDANGVYIVVDKMPQFPGGEEARVKYMVNNVKYPMSAKDKGVQGMVIVSFVVEKDGSINEVKVIKGIEKSCDEEALRVIKGMPNWKPGSQKGKTVRVRFTMPIMFKLA